MKTLVIASGKGGTGKTTLTALLANSLTAGGTVALVDCDVEASNLPLALKPLVHTTSLFQGGGRAIVDPERCQGCGRCQSACRFDAIRAVNGPNGTRYVDRLACEGCGVCEAVCLNGAVRLESGQAGRIFEGEIRLGSIAFAQLDPGEDLSGKLVTQVRARGAKLAARSQASLMIVDGPPGIGCPLIASVSNVDGVLAVAEPSVSGAHDLTRLAQLVRRLHIPLKAVLNKADLSTTGGEQLKAVCASEQVELIGELPFDPCIASSLGRLAEGTGACPVPSAWPAPIREAIADLAKRVAAWMT